MAYRLEKDGVYTLESEYVSYTGWHDPNEVFCEIKWCIVDLLTAMFWRGIELTDENIAKAIKAVDYLYDRSIEEGWETMDVLLSLEDWE